MGGDLVTVFKYMKCTYKDDSDRLLSVAARDSARNNILNCSKGNLS